MYSVRIVLPRPLSPTLLIPSSCLFFPSLFASSLCPFPHSLSLHPLPFPPLLTLSPPCPIPPPLPPTHPVSPSPTTAFLQLGSWPDCSRGRGHPLWIRHCQDAINIHLCVNPQGFWRQNYGGPIENWGGGNPPTTQANPHPGDVSCVVDNDQL